MTDLPHDQYIADVADTLTQHGITVTRHDTSTPDDEILDGWITPDPASVSTDTWPHGVALCWSQQQGWQLIEQGGGRNLHPLDPEAVGVYSSPRQVACSAANALRGYLTTGPICNDGTWVWDSRALEAAVAAWEAEES